MYGNNLIHKLTACVLLIYSTSCNAAPWKFELAPYLWAINMNGDVQIAARGTHISENAADIFKLFKGGGMLWFNADKDKFGLFANALYANLGKDTSILGVTVKSGNKFGLFSIGAAYTVYEKNYAKNKKLTFQPYLGLRYTLNNSSVSVLNTNLSASNDQHWTDPIVGGRLRYINNNWRATFAGDIGGTNFNNDKSFNIVGLIGYNPQSLKLITFYAGYRLLYQKYITGSGLDYFAWNMRLFGPIIGFSIGF